jgi:hypothetical protein
MADGKDSLKASRTLVTTPIPRAPISLQYSYGRARSCLLTINCLLDRPTYSTHSFAVAVIDILLFRDERSKFGDGRCLCIAKGACPSSYKIRSMECEGLVRDMPSNGMRRSLGDLVRWNGGTGVTSSITGVMFPKKSRYQKCGMECEMFKNVDSERFSNWRTLLERWYVSVRHCLPRKILISAPLH